MRHWDLSTLSVEPQSPTILHSVRGESRSIVLQLTAGDDLADHEVHEHAHLVVIDGEVEIVENGTSTTGGPGLLAVFEPGERHAVRALSDARLLLFLAPWPGAGHPGARDD